MSEMKKRPWMLACVALVFALLWPSLLGAAQEGEEKPNIIVIVADDLGYADLGCQGGREMSTPNIDALATQSTRFTNGYVSGPVCAPTRAGLMTGRYQARFGYENLTKAVPTQIKTDRGVSMKETLLPQYLKTAGYRTGAIGKWHLGYNPKYRPNNRGFDYFFGFLPGGHHYYEWTRPLQGVMGGPIYRNQDPVEGEGYLTEKFTEEAVDFIKRNQKAPFFLYLAYFNVHTPLLVPEKYCEGLPADMPKDRRTMVGMVHALDAGVGQVLTTLRELNLEKDTLVFFLGDNGGVMKPFSSNGPLSHGKTTLYEGGIRVPFMVRWPGRVPAGKTYDKPVISLDILPTLVTAAGGKLPGDREIDGVDLVPYLAGAKTDRPHDVLFWRYGPEGDSLAIRRGDMKLLIHQGEAPRLYDLAHDISEKHDLAQDRPEVAKRLNRELMEWNARMPKVPW